MIKSFLWDLRGRLKKKNMSKYSCFQDDKSFWPKFRRIIECDEPPEAIYWGPQVFVIVIVELIGAFF